MTDVAHVLFPRDSAALGSPCVMYTETWEPAPAPWDGRQWVTAEFCLHGPLRTQCPRQVRVIWDSAPREVVFPEGHWMHEPHHGGVTGSGRWGSAHQSDTMLTYPVTSCSESEGWDTAPSTGLSPPPAKAVLWARPFRGCTGRRGGPGSGLRYLLASEITLLVASASCWHLIFSAVAFSNADVRLLRLALSSWRNKVERTWNGATLAFPATPCDAGQGTELPIRARGARARGPWAQSGLPE